MRRVPLLLFCGFILVSGVPMSAQKTDINRYTLFTGFDYMVSPARNLTERGFETDFGVTTKPWLGLGIDFGVLSGAGTITGTETVYAPAVNQLIPGAAASTGKTETSSKCPHFREQSAFSFPIRLTKSKLSTCLIPRRTRCRVC